MTLRTILRSHEDDVLTVVCRDIAVVRYSAWFLRDIIPSATQDRQATIDGNVVVINEKEQTKNDKTLG